MNDPISISGKTPAGPCPAPARDPEPQFQLRRMTSADLAHVQEIDRLSFSLPWPASAFQYELYENTSSLLWVAEDRDGQVIGVIIVWMILDEAHVATLAVLPDWRRRGVAAELLARALLDAIEQRAEVSTLEVRVSNTAAQALYARFGYHEAGRRRRYYRDNGGGQPAEDALIMTKNGLDETYRQWLLQGGWRNNSARLLADQ